MMRSGTRFLAVVTVLGVAAAVPAQDRARGDGADRGRAAVAGDVSNLDLSNVEYYRLHTTGLVEYAFTPPAAMSPTGSGLPRPAYIVGYSFLALNAAALDIRQIPSEFRYVSTERLCDGSEVVRFEQTANRVRVESSFVDLLVQAQRVRHVTARFVRDIALLPLCNWVPPAPPGEIRYRVETQRSIVIAVVIEGVSSGSSNRTRYSDACTGEDLGLTYNLK